MAAMIQWMVEHPILYGLALVLTVAIVAGMAVGAMLVGLASNLAGRIRHLERAVPASWYEPRLGGSEWG